MSWLWFSAPVLIAFLIEAAHFKNQNVSRTIPKTIAVLYPIGFLIYLSEVFISSSDAQAGLLSAMMPMYQLIAIVLILFGQLVNHAFSKPQE